MPLDIISFKPRRDSVGVPAMDPVGVDAEVLRDDVESRFLSTGVVGSMGVDISGGMELRLVSGWGAAGRRSTVDDDLRSCRTSVASWRMSASPAPEKHGRGSCCRCASAVSGPRAGAAPALLQCGDTAPRGSARAFSCTGRQIKSLPKQIRSEAAGAGAGQPESAGVTPGDQLRVRSQGLPEDPCHWRVSPRVGCSVALPSEDISSSMESSLA